MKTILSAVCFLASLSLASAQISIVDSGATGNQVNLSGAYTQSFDTLANATTASVPWYDNSTLPGWYAYRNSTGMVYAYNPSQSLQEFGSFGILGETDRALGSGLGSVSGDFLHFGVQFVNNSSAVIAGIDVSFDGEQWYFGTRFGQNIESLEFSYQIFDAGQGSLSTPSGWTAASELLFVSPINGGEPVRRALNGNLAENREAGIAGSFTGLTLAPNQELWIRWTASNNPYISDDSLAIDNLSVRFHAIPEPATCAVFAGGLVFFRALRRRRR